MSCLCLPSEDVKRSSKLTPGQGHFASHPHVIKGASIEDVAATQLQRMARGIAARRLMAERLGVQPVYLKVHAATTLPPNDGVSSLTASLKASLSSTLDPYVLVVALDPKALNAAPVNPPEGWEGPLSAFEAPGSDGIMCVRRTAIQEEVAPLTGRAIWAEELLLTGVSRDAWVVVSVVDKSTVGADTVLAQGGFRMSDQKRLMGLSKSTFTLDLLEGEHIGLTGEVPPPPPTTGTDEDSKEDSGDDGGDVGDTDGEDNVNLPTGREELREKFGFALNKLGKKLGLESSKAQQQAAAAAKRKGKGSRWKKWAKSQYQGGGEAEGEEGGEASPPCASLQLSLRGLPYSRGRCGPLMRWMPSKYIFGSAGWHDCWGTVEENTMLLHTGRQDELPSEVLPLACIATIDEVDMEESMQRPGVTRGFKVVLTREDGDTGAIVATGAAAGTGEAAAHQQKEQKPLPRTDSSLSVSSSSSSKAAVTHTGKLVREQEEVFWCRTEELEGWVKALRCAALKAQMNVEVFC